MEKQSTSSLWMKPTRFLVFSLTISSSLIFLAVAFSIWLLTATPPPPPPPSPFQQEEQETPGLLDPDASSSYLLDLSATTTNFFPTPANLQDISVSQLEATSPTTTTTTTTNQTTFFKGIHRSTTTTTTTTSLGGGLETKLNSGVVADSYNGILSGKPGNNENASGTGSPPHTHSRSKSCDVSKGMWVFDQSYPLYRNTSCPYIDEGFNCEANGRLDRDYMKWRWQPRDCDIPRFNASKMLDLIRGKRVVFVGDSLNRNQGESMLCLLMGGIKDPKKVYERRGRKITKSKGDYCFKFVDYRCTVEFHVTHFLVQENSKARIGKKRVQTLRIDTIDKSSSNWRGADILVFNTAHWWSHHKTKAGINYYQEGDQIHPRLEVSVALRKALATWASWVDKYVDPRQTRVFFRSSAPSHFSGGQWDTGGHCKQASRPTNATTSGYSPPTMNSLVEEVIKQMKTPVTFLNISGLSNYRIDGHPSVFGRKSDKSNYSGVQDCSHWCLPGVPDSWNELLYYHLLSDGTTHHIR